MGALPGSNVIQAAKNVAKTGFLGNIRSAGTFAILRHPCRLPFCFLLPPECFARNLFADYSSFRLLVTSRQATEKFAPENMDGLWRLSFLFFTVFFQAFRDFFLNTTTNIWCPVTKGFSPTTDSTVWKKNPQWSSKATSGVFTFCCYSQWLASVNIVRGTRTDLLLPQLKWSSVGRTRKSRSSRVWTPSRTCVQCCSSPGWWTKKVLDLTCTS